MQWHPMHQNRRRKRTRSFWHMQIQQQGIDSVITRLQKGEKPGEISKTTKSVGSKS